jgi:DNA-binding NtrC family response regulator
LSEKIITENDVISFANPDGSDYEAKIIQKSNDHLFNYDTFSNFQEFKDHAELEFIKYKLEKNNWNVSKTAEELEIQRSHLYSKIEKFNLKRNDLVA